MPEDRSTDNPAPQARRSRAMDYTGTPPRRSYNAPIILKLIDWGELTDEEEHFLKYLLVSPSWTLKESGRYLAIYKRNEHNLLLPPEQRKPLVITHRRGNNKC